MFFLKKPNKKKERKMKKYAYLIIGLALLLLSGCFPTATEKAVKKEKDFAELTKFTANEKHQNDNKSNNQPSPNDGVKNKTQVIYLTKGGEYCVAYLSNDNPPKITKKIFFPPEFFPEE